MNHELVAIPKETALAVFQEAGGLDPYLAHIRAEIDAFVPDVSSRKGREAIASIAHKVARSKTALDNIGKELVADLKELPKKIDAERKRMRDTLDAWRDEVRAPLTEWEEAEKARVQAHEDKIDWLNNRDDLINELSAAQIAERIAETEAVEIGAHWEEFEAEAARAKDRALATLRDALTKRQQYEAEQAELERLRAEAAEREQKEREERIAREAAEAAQREAAEAARRREIELQLAAERAEREKLEAQQRAEQAERDAEAKAKQAAETERRRQADEQARIEAEAKAREADREHKANINRAALEAFIANGLPEECAKQAVTLIAKRQIPHVAISY